jgi:2-hydroxychromene-2-carboxylate isomerase
MTPLRFCFDFVSPYSYLAWTQIHALAARHRREVEPWPIVFGAVLGAMGTRGPAEIPPKRAYLIKDVIRLAHTFGVPIALPQSHPFNPLLALRVASLPLAPELRRALIDRLYAAVWAGGPGVTDRATVAAICAEAGVPAAALDEAESAEGKQRLRRQTDEALAAGAFGVPTMLVDGELFWGVDSLPHLERFLRGEDPVDPKVVQQWAALPSSATRR